jgi:hypothetical protein
MSLALQRCRRRENDSAKRRLNASLGNVSADLIQTDLIQTDFSLAGEDAGCRTGTDELQSAPVLQYAQGPSYELCCGVRVSQSR